MFPVIEVDLHEVHHVGEDSAVSSWHQVGLDELGQVVVLAVLKVDHQDLQSKGEGM